MEEKNVTEKYLSIITNFGCHGKCPYCIVRENGINVPKTTLDGLNNLKTEIIKNNCNIVSVSGGGEPLWEYDIHKDYYDDLLDICNSMNIPVEMHTSLPINMFDMSQCKRVVYHLRELEQLKYVHREGHEIVRVVWVVTEKFTKEMIDYIADFVKNSNDIDELSFRQMVDNNYQTTHYMQEYLENGHKKDWWYIKQSDYNLYYVNGVVYDTFADIHA